MSSILCNLCGPDDSTVRYPATLSAAETPDARAFRCTSAGYGHHAQIVQCNHCGYVYANPRWDSDELIVAKHGAVEDETYVLERIGRRLTFERHLQHFERFARRATAIPCSMSAHISGRICRSGKRSGPTKRWAWSRRRGIRPKPNGTG